MIREIAMVIFNLARGFRPKILGIFLFLAAQAMVPEAFGGLKTEDSAAGAPTDNVAATSDYNSCVASGVSSASCQPIPEEDICSKGNGGEIPGIEFKFFDRDWHFREWEAAQQNLKAQCLAWNKNKQDSQTISALVKARNLFTQLSLQAPDRMIDAAIQRLGPARDQEDTKLCFAHAAADVATYHAGQRVSAFSVALRFFQNVSGAFAVVTGVKSGGGRYSTGGYDQVTLRTSLKDSLCPEDQPTDNLYYRDQDLKELWNIYESKYRTYYGSQEPVELYAPIQKNLAKIAPYLDSADFIKHLSRYKHLDDALGEWFDRQCSIKVQKNGALQVVAKITGFVKALDSALAAKEIALLRYNVDVLEVNNPPFLARVLPYDGHVSAIIGEARIAGVNYFLLRNSWGSSCGFYASKIASRCVRGHIWLTEDEISKYGFGVSYYTSAQE